MTAQTLERTEPVSRNCEDGHHGRCTGTVYVGRRLVKCGCVVPDCGHGAE